MFFSRWLHTIKTFSQSWKSRQSHKRKRQSRKVTLALEVLEDRVMPSVAPLTLADPSVWGDTGYYGVSGKPSMSADGQLIVFESEANNLVPNDFNNAKDIFLYDRGTGRVSLVSVDKTGTGSGINELVGIGNWSRSFDPRITPDGRYVVFLSYANDLTNETAGGLPGVFVRDLVNNTTTLISIDTGGTTEANGGCSDAVISPDGSLVAFASFANNLVAGDTNNQEDVFVRYWRDPTPTTVRISLSETGSEGNANSSQPVISGNGRFVAFVSYAGLSSIDGNGIDDVYVRDLVNNTTKLVSADITYGFSANAHAGFLSDQSISADGRFVVFHSYASNLVSENTSFQTNAFIRDLQANGGQGQTYLLSRNRAGNGGSNGFNVTITPDGRYAAWVSLSNDTASDIVDTNGFWDVFRSDLTNLGNITTRLVSVNSAGTNGGDNDSGLGMYPYDFSVGSQLTPDGRYVAFASEASNLAAGFSDANNGQSNQVNRRDVFVRDMQSNLTRLISVAPGGSSTGNSGSFTPAMSADGQVVAFESRSTDLVAADRNGQQDVFVRDLSSGFTELASRRSLLLPEENLTAAGVDWLEDVTPDGRYMAFLSTATDLTPAIASGGSDNVYLRDRLTGAVELISVLPNGTNAGSAEGSVRISADGRYVFFNSRGFLDASVDPVGRYQVYRRDRLTGTTQMVSVSTTAGVGSSSAGLSEISISPDGRYIAWTSEATDLISGFTDGNGSSNDDVFLRDMVTGVTSLVSHVSGNLTTSGNNYSHLPVFSPDGQKIIFVSLATDLAVGVTDTNSKSDVFVYDLAAQDVQLVSVSTTANVAGNAWSGDDTYAPPVVSNDGRYVIFESDATDLTALPVSGRQVYRRDLNTGTTELISINSAGTGGADTNVYGGFISADGQKIVFESNASNLVAQPTGGYTQIYLRDLSGAPVTRLISANTAATAGGNANSKAGIDWGANAGYRITADGRYISFLSQATDLVSGFVNGNGTAYDLYLHDTQTGRTVLASYNNSGTASGNQGAAQGPPLTHNGIYLLTANGPTVVFDSTAGDMVNGDRNAADDLFAFTYQGDGRISGTIFNDANGNGVNDGETGLRYWTVYLDANGNSRFDAGEVNVQTDAAGNYQFTNLAAGTYSVAAVFDNHYTPTAPASPYVHPVTLATDTSSASGKDFGAKPATTDLALDQVIAPATGSLGQPFTVSWLVRNAGSNAISGSWQDAVFLSTDDTLEANDLLLTTVARSGGLAAYDSYSASATVTLAGLLPGTYHLFVQTDRRYQVAGETNRDNNLLEAGNPLVLSIPQLTLGTPLADLFTAPG